MSLDLDEQAPVLSLGPGRVAPPVIRTGVQIGVGQFLVEGIALFNLAHLNPGQEKWLGAALTLAVCAIQNQLEKMANKKLLGRTPAPPVLPPEG